MKVYISAMSKIRSRGVFWDIDGDLLAFPFVEDEYGYGYSKSGNTYNHKRLWNSIKPRGCNKSYNYYPRGRVELRDYDKADIIYMNPNVDENLIPDIKIQFGLIGDVKVVYDNSEHYKCYLDDGWKADR